MRRLIGLLLFFGSSCNLCYAVWAKHVIVDPENGLKQFPLRMTVSKQETGNVIIRIPADKSPADNPKGYFLVTAVSPLPAEQLEFRSAMLLWHHHTERRDEWRQRHPDHKIPMPDAIQHIKDIRPLEVSQAGDRYEVHVQLDRETASRSYIVYDFKPMGGGLVMDGGYWITYDLPAFLGILSGKTDE